MSNFLYVFLLVLFVVKTRCTNLPDDYSDESSYLTVKYTSYFTACSESDPQLNECVEDNIREGGPSFTKGIPELGIPPLDPVKLGIIKLNNPSLKLVFSDAELTGLSNFQLNSFNLNLGSNKAALDFTANVSLKGHYYMDGQVLLLPVKGDGQTRIKITNLNIKIKYKYEIRDGFWRIVEYKDTHKMDRANFKFTNMFGGHNLELAEYTTKFMNTHWDEIMKDISVPIIEDIVERCINILEIFYSKIPARKLINYNAF